MGIFQKWITVYLSSAGLMVGEWSLERSIMKSTTMWASCSVTQHSFHSMTQHFFYYVGPLDTVLIHQHDLARFLPRGPTGHSVTQHQFTSMNQHFFYHVGQLDTVWLSIISTAWLSTFYHVSQLDKVWLSVSSTVWISTFSTAWAIRTHDSAKIAQHESALFYCMGLQDTQLSINATAAWLSTFSTAWASRTQDSALNNLSLFLPRGPAGHSVTQH